MHFGTIWSGTAQLLEEGRTIPSWDMWSNSFLAIIRRSGANQRVRPCTAGPVVLIWCITECLTGRSLKDACVTHFDPLVDLWHSKLVDSTTQLQVQGIVCPDQSSTGLARIRNDDSNPYTQPLAEFPACKKSAPRIGCGTSAIMKTHGNKRRRPMSGVSECTPKVAISEPLTA